MSRKQSIEAYLHQHIPLSKAMEVSVRKIEADKVVLSAPLAPNINHRSTAFGGSISTLATLAAWTFVHVKLQSLSMSCRIVIQNHSIDYLRPIDSAFEAHCCAPPEREWQRFIKMINQRGKGRIRLLANVYGDDEVAGRFQGQYVAIDLDQNKLS